jgi:hypothetical protein
MDSSCGTGSNMVKKIAVYGSYEAKVPSKQRYWKRRRDGIRQRYWKKTAGIKTVEKKGRYEFSGKGKDLYKAVVKTDRIVPKGFINISVEKFLKNPEKYGFEGEWIEREIES